MEETADVVGRASQDRQGLKRSTGEPGLSTTFSRSARTSQLSQQESGGAFTSAQKIASLSREGAAGLKESAVTGYPHGRRPSGKVSESSGIGSLKTAASLISRISGSALSGRGLLRSRSVMSLAPVTPRSATSRLSVVSRGSRMSRATTQSGPVDYGLSPGLHQLIGRLADTKDVGLIAYLSAIPGEPLRAARPPAAIAKLQRKQSAWPKSIMRITKPQVRFEPTYRVQPLRPFREERARAVVRAALDTAMAGASYSEQWATDASRILAAYITQCIKGLDAQGGRYKIGTMVSVMERHSQGVRIEMGVLWDEERDRCVAAHVETTTMTAFAVVYAVYWD